jgi:cold shock CspA family protein
LVTGTVKFFNNEEDRGLTSRDGGDTLVRYSNIQGSGCTSLEEGQRVEYRGAPGHQGDEAQNIRVI